MSQIAHGRFDRAHERVDIGVADLRLGGPGPHRQELHGRTVAAMGEPGGRRRADGTAEHRDDHEGRDPRSGGAQDHQLETSGSASTSSSVDPPDDTSASGVPAKVARAVSRAAPACSGSQPVTMYWTRCPMLTAWSPMRS